MPYFISDITDGIHLQCIASLFFMYFACLTPIITFGGLLGAATDNNLVSTCLYKGCLQKSVQTQRVKLLFTTNDSVLSPLSCYVRCE